MSLQFLALVFEGYCFILAFKWATALSASLSQQSSEYSLLHNNLVSTSTVEASESQVEELFNQFFFAARDDCQG
jgi:hypothetical protein